MGDGAKTWLARVSAATIGRLRPAESRQGERGVSALFLRSGYSNSHDMDVLKLLMSMTIKSAFSSRTPTQACQ